MKLQSDKGIYFFRLLVNKYFTGKADSLAKLLPKEEVDALMSIRTPLKSPELMLFNFKAWLAGSDPSWFTQAIQALHPALQKLYSGIISPNADAQTKQLSEPVVHFLLNYLHDQSQEEEARPKEFIDTGELRALLDLKKSDLLDIVDLLSMYDLVDEVRHIVDKRILQTISQLLTLPQQQYLRMCLRQKTKPHAPSFTLRELLKEPKKFHTMLQKQGLKRFALALNGESKDFIWHIMHTLDVSRAAFLKQEVKPEPTPHATRMAQLEILQILQFLKVGSKS